MPTIHAHLGEQWQWYVIPFCSLLPLHAFYPLTPVVPLLCLFSSSIVFEGGCVCIVIYAVVGGGEQTCCLVVQTPSCYYPPPSHTVPTFRKAPYYT